MLEAALTAGILSVGAHVTAAGIVPTPAVAHLVRKYGADAGVVISASHNTVEYNGIKFFNCDGFKLSDEIEDEIESYIFGQQKIGELPYGDAVGMKTVADDAGEDYIKFAVDKAKCDFSGMTIALDCANGAAYHVAPAAIERLGAAVHVIHNRPTGLNINDKCGSTHVEDLQKFVVDSGADIGIAFDGDADRLIAVDETGKVIDGDVIMGLCAMQLKEQGLLKDDTLVATVMSNLGLLLSCEKQGIKVLQAKVGDRYVLEEMQKNGYNLGGEQSGHIIFLEENTTGDGLVSAIMLISMLKQSGKTASALASQITILPQILVNATIKNEHKNALDNDVEVKAMIDMLDKKYDGCGRLLVRASGTEPLVRVMIEGQDIEDMTSDAENLKNLLISKFA